MTQTVILAGGLGSRLSEETQVRPKPMVEIGGRPLLWHIMKTYSHYGLTDFVICLGYKGYVIKEYFANYFLHGSDVTFDLGRNTTEIHHAHVEPWRVTLIDTGQESMTGGRLLRVRDYLEDDTFCFTYGDAVADVAIDELLAFHRAHGKKATVTAVQPPGRFGALELSDTGGAVERFVEKPSGDNTWINGGFFVLEPSTIDLIAHDGIHWELEPMQKLVADGELHAFTHDGFWQPMDTLRDHKQLEQLWQAGNPPWRVW